MTDTQLTLTYIMPHYVCQYDLSKCWCCIVSPSCSCDVGRLRLPFSLSLMRDASYTSGGLPVWVTPPQIVLLPRRLFLTWTETEFCTTISLFRLSITCQYMLHLDCMEILNTYQAIGLDWLGDEYAPECYIMMGIIIGSTGRTETPQQTLFAYGSLYFWLNKLSFLYFIESTTLFTQFVPAMIAIVLLGHSATIWIFSLRQKIEGPQ